MKLSFDNENAIYELNNISQIIPVRELAYNLFKTYDLNGLQGIPNILPSNIRWISDDGLSLLVEREPCQIMINYKKGSPNATRRGEEETFLISLPWQVYVLNISSREISIFFRNTSITSLENNLYNACISNVFNTGLGCLGNDQVDEIKDLLNREVSTTEIINCMINSFWMNQFNDDLRIPVTILPQEMLANEEMRRKIIDDAVISGYDLDDATFMYDCGDYSNFLADAHSVYSYLENITLDEVVTLNWTISSELLSRKTASESFFNRSNWTSFLRNLFVNAANNPNPMFVQEEEEEDLPEEENDNFHNSCWYRAENEMSYIRRQYAWAGIRPVTNTHELTVLENEILRLIDELETTEAQ